MKRLKLPILLSFATHAAIFCAAAAGLYFIGSKLELGMTGPSVGVFLSGNSGQPGLNQKSSQATKQKPEIKPDQAALKEAAPAAAEQNSAKSDNDRNSESKGNATSEGTSSGDNAGSSVGLGSASGAGDQTLARIWRKINGSKYYPEIAKQQGAEGAPRVTFSIREDGSVKEVQLATSCGKGILDDAAIETIKRAAPLPYFPKPITLAVKYSLR